MEKQLLSFCRLTVVSLLFAFGFALLPISAVPACAISPSVDEKYVQAKELLFSRQFDPALELFGELGDYKDSCDLAKYARSYIENEPESIDSFFQDRYIVRTYPSGKLYSLSKYGTYHNKDIYKGDIYLPDKIDSTTTFVQYFCGGGYGEDYLWYNGVYNYFNEYSPNSIIVFTNESGTTRIKTRLEYQWRILCQIARECGTIVHDLSSIGSSNGCYTAMKLAASYYTNYGLKTVRTLTLDTGVSWNLSNYALTPEECEAVAEAETEFFLFESTDFLSDLQKGPIKSILASGIPTTAFICKQGNHDIISRNAYAFGLFSFCGGDRTELPESEYFPVRLYEGITDLGEVIWPE